jgi:TolB-like protein
MNSRLIIRCVLLLGIALCSGASGADGTSVSLLPLANLSQKPDLQYLSASLPDSLATTLKNTGKFRVRPQKDVKAQRLPDGSVPFNEALAACRSSGDELMITGNYALIGDTIRVSLEAVDVKTGRIKIAEAVTGEAGIGIFDLVDSLCDKMADRMLKELPRIQEAASVREKVSVETVYLEGSRKNSWFFTELGLALHSLRAEEKSGHTRTGTITLISLGYGFKGWRFIFSGCPPVFVRNLEGNVVSLSYDNEIEAQVEYSLLSKRLQLIGGYRSARLRSRFEVSYFDGSVSRTNFRDYSLLMDLLELGARFRPFKSGVLSKFSGCLKAGIPLTQKIESEGDTGESLLRAKGGLFLKAELEWMFLSKTGLRLGYALTKGRSGEPPGPYNALDKLSLTSHSVYLSLCYNVDF